MADNLTKEQRKKNMSAIRSRHTKPEMIVRSIIHRLGFRFRLHDPKLPGKPDIVLPRHKKIILVHGCFWHQHYKKSCLDGRAPKSNLTYWGGKLARNVNRDARNLAELNELGWRVLVVWECEALGNSDVLTKRICRFLEPTK